MIRKRRRGVLWDRRRRVGLGRGLWRRAGLESEALSNVRVRVGTAERLPALPWGPRPGLLSIPSVEPQPVIIHSHARTHVHTVKLAPIHTQTL